MIGSLKARTNNALIIVSSRSRDAVNVILAKPTRLNQSREEWLSNTLFRFIVKRCGIKGFTGPDVVVNVGRLVDFIMTYTNENKELPPFVEQNMESTEDGEEGEREPDER
jgi:hypothetical protein